MSKPVKELIQKDYEGRFDGLEGALVVDIRGIGANQNNELRLNLLEQRIRVTVVKNTLARKAITGTPLEAVGPALDGPSALCYGIEGATVIDVARSLVDWAKKIEKLDLKGAVLDGEYFDGEAGVKRLSTFPTREEAQAKVVSLILAPGGKVVGAAMAPGSRLVSIIEQVKEKLEKGETIARVG